MKPSRNSSWYTSQTILVCILVQVSLFQLIFVDYLTWQGFLYCGWFPSYFSTIVNIRFFIFFIFIILLLQILQVHFSHLFTMTKRCAHLFCAFIYMGIAASDWNTVIKMHVIQHTTIKFYFVTGNSYWVKYCNNVPLQTILINSDMTSKRQFLFELFYIDNLIGSLYFSSWQLSQKQ